ncbi:MAG: sulfite exporter TauE/SafE family protein, partial [Verrucomicrobiota bacterium]
ASLNEQILSLIIGVAIIGSVFLPPPKRNDKIDLKWFSLFGGISSFLSMIVGAVGPLLAPAFYRAGLSKERLVATKAVCQGTVQLAKVIIFSTTLSFSYADYWQILLLLTGVIVLGTWTGKKVLGKMRDRHFDWFLKAVLLIAGGKIIWDACASFS